MIKPSSYVSSPGNFYLDLASIALAMKSVDGKLIVYLKSSGQPILIECDEVQTEAIIASIIGFNHHVTDL